MREKQQGGVIAALLMSAPAPPPSESLLLQLKEIDEPDELDGVCGDSLRIP